MSRHLFNQVTKKARSVAGYGEEGRVETKSPALGRAFLIAV